MSSIRPSKSSLPNFIRISLPAWGMECPGLPFEEVVEVRRDFTFDAFSNTANPPPAPPKEKPHEIVRSSVTGVKRSISYGVCRVVCQSQRLVIKFALGRRNRWQDALETEANNYKKYLTKVQGSAVPYMYGYYTGITFDEREEPVSCLILEDCGDTLTQPFRELPVEERAKIMRRYCELHLLGLSLKDFAERNVVHKDGSYRLIDFHDIEDIRDHHECHWTGELFEGGPNPGARKIGCECIHTTGVDMGLWGYRAGRVRVLGRLVKGDEYPSQEDIDALCNNADFAVYPPMVDVLHEWLRSYKRVKAQIPLEKYATTRPDVSYTAHRR